MGFRKKFRKMKFKFEQKMSQSNIWYKQEQEAAETELVLMSPDQEYKAHKT